MNNALVAARTECHAEKQNNKLRVVDPFEDEGVWAIVDDGCNSCTHSDYWHNNAISKWEKLGFMSFLKHDRTTSFKGVGERVTTGVHKIPVGLKLEESGVILPGAISSHDSWWYASVADIASRTSQTWFREECARWDYPMVRLWSTTRSSTPKQNRFIHDPH